MGGRGKGLWKTGVLRMVKKTTVVCLKLIFRNVRAKRHAVPDLKHENILTDTQTAAAAFVFESSNFRKQGNWRRKIL